MLRQLLDSLVRDLDGTHHEFLPLSARKERR